MTTNNGRALTRRKVSPEKRTAEIKGSQNKIDGRRRVSGIAPEKFGVRMKRFQREIIKQVAELCGRKNAAGPFCVDIIEATLAGKNARKILKITLELEDIQKIEADLRKTLDDADASVPFILDIRPDQLALLEAKAKAQHLGAAELFRWIVFNVIEGRKVGAAVT